MTTARAHPIRCPIFSDRWLSPPWQTMALESKELMAMCLRKIPGLSKVKLVDAVWIWTEPHSMRLKIKVTLQKEVVRGAILQQATVIEFAVRNQQCKACEAAYAQGAWHGIVQVRQHVKHKRTFYYLEQLLLKNNAHSECIRIVTFNDGMDFYFLEKQNAIRFVDFLEHVVPMTSKYSRKLISADIKQATANYKHNYLVEIAPICKDDLVILPRKLASTLSGISPIVLVKGVTAEIQVIDPFSCERAEVCTDKYYHNRFQSVMSSRELAKFVVLSIEPVLKDARPGAKRRGQAGLGAAGASGKMRLGECVVARERDLGENDDQFTVITHLGSLLKVGDMVLGYDLRGAHWTNDTDILDQLQKGMQLPDVILVRKYYETKGERDWFLNKIEDVVVENANAKSNRETAAEDEDYEHFMQEVEGDRAMRSQLKIYGRNKKPTDAAAMETTDSGADDDDEYIRLEEMISEVTISAGSDGAEAASEARILTAEEAELSSRLNISSPGEAGTPFDEATFDPSTFKFT